MVGGLSSSRPGTFGATLNASLQIHKVATIGLLHLGYHLTVTYVHLCPGPRWVTYLWWVFVDLILSEHVALETKEMTKMTGCFRSISHVLQYSYTYTEQCCLTKCWCHDRGSNLSIRVLDVLHIAHLHTAAIWPMRLLRCVLSIFSTIKPTWWFVPHLHIQTNPWNEKQNQGTPHPI